VQQYLEIAISEATIGVQTGDGAPFGACIVKEGEVIAKSHDTVLKDQDATCHAEMNVIRMASQQIDSYKLTDCVIYCTSEPCPMCLSAIYWSGIRECHYISDRDMTHRYGFDDDVLYQELNNVGSQRKVQLHVQSELQQQVENIFLIWQAKGLPPF